MSDQETSSSYSDPAEYLHPRFQKPSPFEPFFQGKGAFNAMFSDSFAQDTLREASRFMPETGEAPHDVEEMLEYYTARDVISPDSMGCFHCQMLAEPYRALTLAQHAFVRAIYGEADLCASEPTDLGDLEQSAHYEAALGLVSMLKRLNSLKSNLEALYWQGPAEDGSCSHTHDCVYPNRYLIDGYGQAPYWTAFELQTRFWDPAVAAEAMGTPRVK